MCKQEWNKPQAKELDVLMTAAYYSTYDLWVAAEKLWLATFNPGHPNTSTLNAWEKANTYS